jgi:hypothetical protein
LLAFWPVSERVQVKFYLTQNVHILCLSCNVEKIKSNRQILWKKGVILVLDLIKLFWYLIDVEQMIRKNNSISAAVIEDTLKNH